MLSLLLALLAAADSATPPTRELTERDLVERTEEVRLSLPTEVDSEAWTSSGLRLALGYGYASWVGKKPAWSLTAHSFLLRPQVRLDQFWSLASTIRFSAFGGLGSGLQWSTTLEPTFHPTRHLGISFGLGYGGLSGSLAAPDPVARPDEAVSLTLTDGRTLNDCDGSGLSALARVEYLAVAGALFSTGPFAQADLQWTGCQTTISRRPDAETGKQIVGTQWWRQQGGTVGWWAAWR